MKTKLSLPIILLAAIPPIATIAVFGRLPETVVTHWGINGNPNGYSSKWMQLVLAFLPMAMYSFMVLIPKIDPKRKSYEMHAKAYRIFQAAMTAFMSLLAVVTLMYNLGIRLDITMIVNLGCAVLFVILGNFMSQIRHNYFFGIRTPWTLASETVWRKTHRVGGYLFSLSGILTGISALMSPVISFTVLMVSILGATLVSTVYSYIAFRSENKEK